MEKAFGKEGEKLLEYSYQEFVRGISEIWRKIMAKAGNLF